MEIIIVCTKGDFYFAKLCVTSIRYFYPDIKISLLKDYTKGNFTTNEIEKYLNVGIVDLGIKKYGWGIAKVHATISSHFKAGTKLLLLDADIIFIGSVLNKLEQLIECDVIVQPEAVQDVRSDFVKNTYFDIDEIKKIEPDYRFPGYTFNTGQIVITAGKLKDIDFSKYLDFNKHPFWNKEYKFAFPLADQSLLNVIVHNKENEGEFSVGKAYFAKWPEWHEYKSINLKDFKSQREPFLMHWAGCKRVAALQYMSHSDILFYLKKRYYSNLPVGFIRYYLDTIYQTIKYRSTTFLRSLKRHLSSL